MIIVRNKIDLNTNHTAVLESKREECNELQSLSKNVQLFFDVSAKTNKDITNLFFSVQKIISYPIAPLYDSVDKELTAPYRRILVRLFRVFDKDRDDALSDKELNDFQYTCYGSRLDPIMLKAVKSSLRTRDTDCLTGDQNDYITCRGFMELHKLLISKNKPETAWINLKTFDYNNELVYEPILSPNSSFTRENLQEITRKSERTIELSAASTKFLIALFKQYNKNPDKCLSPTEIASLFEPLPDRLPPWTHVNEDVQLFFSPSFPQNTLSNDIGCVTLPGYLSMWSLYMHICPYECIYSIMQLGFGETFEDVAILTNTHAEDSYRYNLYKRSVTHSFIIGQSKDDMLCFLNDFISKPSNNRGDNSNSSVSTFINSVEADEDLSTNKYIHSLMMTCFSPESMSLFTNQLYQCDICCLMFDLTDPTSFQYIKDIIPTLPPTLKIMLIANNKTLSMENSKRSALYKEAEEYCRSLEIKPPVINHVKSPRKEKIFSIIYAMAHYPDVCIPYNEHKRTVSKYIKFGFFTSITLIITGVVTYFLKPDLFKDLFKGKKGKQ
ncbi:hypothetical protein WA158_002961 [Blastocystis sp. Blastoise]